MERNKVSIDCILGKITLMEIGDPQSPDDVDVVRIAGVFGEGAIFSCCGHQVAISRSTAEYRKAIEMVGKSAIWMKEV